MKRKTFYINSDYIRYEKNDKISEMNSLFICGYFRYLDVNCIRDCLDQFVLDLIVLYYEKLDFVISWHYWYRRYPKEFTNFIKFICISFGENAIEQGGPLYTLPHDILKDVAKWIANNYYYVHGDDIAIIQFNRIIRERLEYKKLEEEKDTIDF